MFQRKYFICLVSLLIPFISLSIQASTQLVPLESYSASPEISMVKISPDGSRLAYRAISGEQDILMVKDMTSGKLVAAINIKSINPEYAYFIDNDKVILRASEFKHIQGYRGMHDVSSAFVFDVEEKEVRQLLIPGYGIYRGQTTLGDIVGISPDKKSVYMPAYMGDETIALHVPTYELTRVSLEKKRKPWKLRKGTHDAIDFFVNESGEVIARERYNDKTNRHLVQSYIDGKWVDIFSEETPYRTKSFSGLTQDRKHLVMTKTGDNGRRTYYKMSLLDGTVSEPIFSRDDADVEAVLTNIERVVYGVRYSGFKPSYEFFDKKLNNKFKAIQKAMPNSAFYLVDHTEDWSKIVFLFEGDMSAGSYLLFANNGFDYIASRISTISAEQVHSIKEYSYQARDGLTIPTLLTYPKLPSKSLKNLPAIMMPHGGPESYDTIGFDWLAQYFANRGFLVIQPQFRGSKGFGLDHLLKGRGEWGAKMQDDLTDAVSALVKDGTIDPNNVCIVGASYGGYAALAGATMTPDLYKCVISLNGVSDVEEMLETEEDDHGKDSSILSYWQEVINKEKLSGDFLKKISPINHADKVKAPVLLIHGTRDRVVHSEQSEDFFDKLEDLDKDVTYVELEDEGHHLIQSKSRLQTLQAIEVFLKKHMSNVL